jgi:antitoxin (DNA-binding transcriptional repressor) of toxin-antitoxin stability system
MDANLVDLRRNTGMILKALKKRERVTLSRRGKKIGQIVPLGEEPGAVDILAHPAFGMWKDAGEKSVPETVRDLRRGRFHDL